MVASAISILLFTIFLIFAGRYVEKAARKQLAQQKTAEK